MLKRLIFLIFFSFLSITPVIKAEPISIVRQIGPVSGFVTSFRIVADPKFRAPSWLFLTKNALWQNTEGNMPKRLLSAQSTESWERLIVQNSSDGFIHFLILGFGHGLPQTQFVKWDGEHAQIEKQSPGLLMPIQCSDKTIFARQDWRGLGGWSAIQAQGCSETEIPKFPVGIGKNPVSILGLLQTDDGNWLGWTGSGELAMFSKSSVSNVSRRFGESARIVNLPAADLLRSSDQAIFAIPTRLQTAPQNQIVMLANDAKMPIAGTELSVKNSQILVLQSQGSSWQETVLGAFSGESLTDAQVVDENGDGCSESLWVSVVSQSQSYFKRETPQTRFVLLSLPAESCPNPAANADLQTPVTTH